MENKSPFRNNSEFNLFDTDTDNEETTEDTELKHKKKSKKKANVISEVWSKLFPRPEHQVDDSDRRRGFLKSFSDLFKSNVNVDEQTKENEASQKRTEQGLGKSVRSLIFGGSFDNATAQGQPDQENHPEISVLHPEESQDTNRGEHASDEAVGGSTESIHNFTEETTDEESSELGGGISGDRVHFGGIAEVIEVPEVDEHDHSESNRDVGDARGISDGRINEGSDLNTQTGVGDIDRESGNIVDYGQSIEGNDADLGRTQGSEIGVIGMEDSRAESNINEQNNPTRDRNNQPQRGAEQLGVIAADRLSKSRDKKLKAEADKLKKQLDEVRKKEEETRRTVERNEQRHLNEQENSRILAKNMPREAGSTKLNQYPAYASRANTDKKHDRDNVRHTEGTLISRQPKSETREAKDYSRNKVRSTESSKSDDYRENVSRTAVNTQEVQSAQHFEDAVGKLQDDKNRRRLDEQRFDLGHEAKGIPVKPDTKDIFTTQPGRGIQQVGVGQGGHQGSANQLGRVVNLPVTTSRVSSEYKQAAKQGVVTGIMMLVSLGLIALAWSLIN